MGAAEPGPIASRRETSRGARISFSSPGARANVCAATPTNQHIVRSWRFAVAVAWPSPWSKNGKDGVVAAAANTGGALARVAKICGEDFAATSSK